MEWVTLLTYVLGYDDLLAADAVHFRIDDRPRPIAIGRAAEGRRAAFAEPALFTLVDPWMSSEHATIDRRADADVLVDRDSRNGSWVNGKRVHEHRLADGDLIEVGHSLLVYRRVPRRSADALLARPSPLSFHRTPSFSPEIAVLVRDLERIAPTREPILVLGETGSGKDVLAHMVHELSGRRGALRTVDGGAIPEALFEATFFGHRRGAYTGATEALAGEVERADGGTLFLDEVANLAPSSQAALLRVVEDGCVTPLGAANHLNVDVRWIAATHRDLLSDPGGFRVDLVERLAGYVARVPALRQRREDLGLLAAHLLREAAVGQASITVAAARQLFGGALAGNVRELRATLRAAAALAESRAIDLEHLSRLPVSPEAPAQSADSSAIEEALAATQGNVVRAAERLGTSARQLYRWLEREGIDLERFRPPKRGR
jgi:DNA-binding NtrC family response regulator